MNAGPAVCKPKTLYLYDETGALYAEVAAGAKVRHRKSGKESEVLAVECATRMVRLGADPVLHDDPAAAEAAEAASRCNWRNIDDFEILGKPVSPEAAKREADRLRARLAQLEQVEAQVTEPEAPKVEAPKGKRG